MSDYFFIKDGNKNSHFIRTCTGKLYDITGCSILTDGRIDENDGLVPSAILLSNEEVADLVAESEARTQQLEIVETLLKEWIEIRKARSRRAKQRLQQLQKQEVVK